ncbi:cyanase [Brucella pituitosa]|uniref:Cyanate hydratase n=1 Tax=Brucella pituitosa TaxID=571256 RepID=A0ABS3K1V9_9HYPH|nr:cyanase [Brucella pituitosa]MBO1040887.1 cyanase [Brucella pituitosa]
MLSKSDVTDLIYEKKRLASLTWASIAEGIGMSEVFVTSACLGMNALPRDKADKLAINLGLPQEAGVVLAEYPTKEWDRAVPTDPCIYRLYEIVGVYGPTLKELIQEKSGNGIMSAIDFEMSVDKVANPKGERIEIRMSGKFLSYNSW